MTFREYSDLMKENFLKIKEENILFWNLWNINFVFEKIEDKEYKHYQNLERCISLLWRFNDEKFIDEKLLRDESQAIINFSDDEYTYFDDYNISEFSIRELIVCLQTVIFNINEEIYGYEIYLSPINVIDIILENDGISVIDENSFTNPMYMHEVNAQLKLSELLSKEVCNFTYKDRNIYRA